MSATKKQQSIDKLFSEIEEAVAKMEKEELGIDESLKIYKETMAKIERTQKMLGEMKMKIEEVVK